ncbi:MAG: glycosyltransferase family 87 protein [Candidatus Melainabacteria bacterium]|nr:glycosyltransferase family 87 protein [Candidatus Melainabacteria bacterium]
MSKEKLLEGIRELTPLLFAITAVCWLSFFLVQPFDGNKSDFPQYYTPARLIMTGHGADIYDVKKVSEFERECFPSMGERVLPIYLPPPSQAWFLPLGLLPPNIASIVWRVVQATAMIASLLLLKSSFQLSRKSFLWLIAVLCASGPAFAAFQIEQVSVLLLCALSTAIWGFKKDKPWVTAVALAFLMLKPQEGIPLLVYLAGARKYKQLAMTIAILFIISILACVLIGYQSVINYVTFAYSSVENSGFNQSELGPTVRGQLLRLFPDSKSPIAIVSIMVFLATSVFIYLSGRRFASNKAWLEAGLLIAVPLGLVTCFHLHSYDLTLLAPTVVVLMAGPLEAAIPPVALLASFLLLGSLMIPFYIFIHHNFLLTDHWILNPHFFVVLAFSIGTAFLAYRYPDRLSNQP